MLVDEWNDPKSFEEMSDQELKAWSDRFDILMRRLDPGCEERTGPPGDPIGLAAAVEDDLEEFNDGEPKAVFVEIKPAERKEGDAVPCEDCGRFFIVLLHSSGFMLCSGCAAKADLQAEDKR